MINQTSNPPFPFVAIRKRRRLAYRFKRQSESQNLSLLCKWTAKYNKCGPVNHEFLSVEAQCQVGRWGRKGILVWKMSFAPRSVWIHVFRDSRFQVLALKGRIPWSINPGAACRCGYRGSVELWNTVHIIPRIHHKPQNHAAEGLWFKGLRWGI